MSLNMLPTFSVDNVRDVCKMRVKFFGQRPSGPTIFRESSDFGNIIFFKNRFMMFFSFDVSAFQKHVFNIFNVCAYKKMFGIHAGATITSVANAVSWLYSAFKNFIRKPVSFKIFIFNAKPSIAISIEALFPYPASMIINDEFFQESFFERRLSWH